jgi:hypothetical protein
MDDEGRPTTLWARLVYPLFQQRRLSILEWRLGLVVIGIALLFTWLIFWTFIPRLIGDVMYGIFNGVVWVASLFSGGGATEVATPVLTADPTVLPSPSPLASPSPSPSPSPLPR